MKPLTSNQLKTNFSFIKVLSMLLFLMLFSGLVNAQFSQKFAPNNWIYSTITVGGDGSVDTTGAPASITLIGSDNGVGCCGLYENYAITLTKTGTISFDYNMIQPDLDFGYYTINGSTTLIANSTSNGTISNVAINAGEEFAFRIINNVNCCGRGIMTISNFTFTATSPDITTHPTNQNICHLSNAIFSITANNVTSYQWQENSGSGFADVVDGGIYSGATTSTLILTGVTSTLTGYSYQCITTGGVSPSEASSIASLNVNPEITSTTSQKNITCNGLTDGIAGVYTVAGGTAPYNYLWDFGGTNDVESSLSVGTYTCTITDDNGCTLTKDFTITEPIQILSNLITNNVNCFGLSDAIASVNPSGGILPYTYAWSDGQTTANVTGLSAQTYTVIITDANSCTKTETKAITQPDSISLTPTITNLKCFQANDGSASISVVGGLIPYSYAWSSGSITDAETGLSAGTYSITVLDNNGCVLLESITITEPDSLALNVTTQSVSCNGLSDGAAFTNASGGVVPYIYDWGAGSTSNTSLIGLSSQLLTVSITDANGCQNSEQLTIIEPDSITATVIVTNVLCKGGTGSASVNAIGGTGTLYYAWPSGGSNATELNLPADTYLLAITDDNGCSNDEIITINEPLLALSNTISFANEDCGQLNGSASIVVIGGTGSYSYNWSNGGTLNNEFNLGSGSYTVTVTDANGCTISDAVSISTVGSLTVLASQTSVLCNGDNNGTIDLNVSGGTGNYSYSWSNGASMGSISGLAPATYTYTVSDGQFCQSSGIVTVTEPNILAISYASINEMIGNDGSIDITVTGGVTPYTFDWNDGSTSEDLTNLAAGSYTITVTDAYGCARVETITVSSSVGINQIEVNNSFIVYPNPNNGQFNISGNKTMNYELKNNLGKILQHIQLNINNHYTALINNLNSGVYFINSEDSNFKTIKKIVVIK